MNLSRVGALMFLAGYILVMAIALCAFAYCVCFLIWPTLPLIAKVLVVLIFFLLVGGVTLGAIGEAK